MEVRVLPGAGVFVAGIHRLALGDATGGQCIRRLGRRAAGRRAPTIAPVVAFDPVQGATFGMQGVF